MDDEDLTHSQDGDDDYNDPQLMVVAQAVRSDTVKKVFSNHNSIRNDGWWMKIPNWIPTPIAVEDYIWIRIRSFGTTFATHHDDDDEWTLE